MKKLGFILLVLLLLTVFSSAALANELYDQYGPMYEWGDEEWAISEEWSDEQWEDYRQGQSEVFEKEYRERIRKARQELGCPDPDNVNVKLNDAYLLFDEAKPYKEGYGGTYLPLKAFFSAIGLKADFNYDAQSRSVTVICEDKSTLTVTADEEVIMITRPDEEPLEIISWNEPMLQNGRMYVAASDLCSFLGWDSYWDYSYEILYMVDPKPLIETINKEFSTINRLLKGSMVVDMEQSYSFTGSVSLFGTLYSDEKHDTVSAALHYSGLQKGLDVDMSFDIKLDLKQMQDSIFSFLDDETWSIVKSIGAGKGRLIMNSEAGTMYLQSNLLPLMEKRLGAKDWLKLDYPAQDSGMPLSGDILQEQLDAFSMGQLIYQGSSGYYYGERDVYARTLENAKLWQAILGDANFSQTKSGGFDVYSLSMDKKPLPGTADPFGLFAYSGNDESDNTTKISGLLRFKEKDELVTDMEIKATAQAPVVFPVTYTLDYSGNNVKYQGYLEVKGRYLGKLLFSTEYEAKPTQELPASAPPTGNRVVEEQDLSPGKLFAR